MPEFVLVCQQMPLSSEEENGGPLPVPVPVAGLAGSGVAEEPYYIECPQCRKGCPGFQALKEHVEQAHPAAINGSPPPGSAASPPLTPTPTPPTGAPVNGILPVPAALLSGKGGAHACAQCNSAFSTRDQLEKHELVHSPNIQVSCKVCNKTFANVYRLQRHMISHDESAVLRKFKCPECEKAFKFKHHLKEHIRIHSGEKPFECANCGKRFSHSGSYSSHMTSKKCLVMNLKVSRGANPKNGQPLPRSKRPPQINNNNNTTNNNNNNTAFSTIMPKYGEAAAALFNSFPSPAFYPLPGAMGLASGLASGLNSPYHIGHLLEQLQQQASHSAQLPARSRSPSPSPHSPRSPNCLHHDQDHEDEDRGHDLSSALEVSIEVDVKDEVSSEKDGSIKVELEDASREANGLPETDGGDETPPKRPPHDGDLDRILASVSASVNKTFLEANMRKIPSSPGSSSCPSPGITSSALCCRNCQRSFSSPIDLHQHERYLCPALPDLPQQIKSEGLAAKLEDVATGAPGSGSEEELTDHVSEDGRKVRVRSQITDEQLAILKPHYASNPRPKREELTRIAERVSLPVRVVQVWFQNTRARDRREGRMVHAQAAQQQAQQAFHLQPPHSAEQPLDLSFKKWQHSLNSSPSSSPARSPTRPSSSNSDDGVMNLSRKSWSPPPANAPYRLLCPPYARSPSPLPWRYLAGQKRPFHPDLALFGLTQHLDGRANSSSPGSDRRSWKQCGADGEDTPDETEDSASALEELQHKRRALGTLAAPLTPLLTGFPTPDGSPGALDNEPEGQFICKQCDKVFSKQSSLARHKFEHSGQRPHKCDICPKAFKHKHHLTEHKRLHSGEKPFQCSKCLKRFSHSGSYSQHMNHRYSYCKPYRE